MGNVVKLPVALMHVRQGFSIAAHLDSRERTLPRLIEIGHLRLESFSKLESFKISRALRTAWIWQKERNRHMSDLYNLPREHGLRQFMADERRYRREMFG
jgi:hypothetical protein